MTLTDLAFATGARREPEGWLGHALRAYGVLISLYTIWAAAFSRLDVLSRTMIFLGLMLVLVFVLIGPSPQSDRKKPTVTDYLLSAASLATFVFFALHAEAIGLRMSLFDELTGGEWLFSTLILLLSLEAARRTVGLGLTVIVLLFIAYNLFGQHLPPPFGHGDISFGHFIDIMVLTTDGIFGVPVQVTATYAFLFVMFGTFLERAGGGEFFFDLAAVFAGRRPGGPAKVAVFSSALFGTVSGSPTSDVVTTGSVTIPIMKRLGYPPALAGAVEVAASTGGSILPPVMGAAVFIMAEFTGIQYVTIAIAGIIPALLYYLCIYTQVHLRSLKMGLVGLPPENIPRLLPTLKKGGVFFIPLAVLIWALVEGYTPTYVALYGTLGVLAAWAITPGKRMSLYAVYEALAQTTFQMVAVTGACAAAGMVIGGITMTGLAGKMADLLLLAGGPSLVMTLIIAAAITTLLGMGMPTPAAYALAAALMGPTLVQKLGVPLMTAHYFLLYFAVMSAMTPPVAVAAYAASAIANENPLAIAVAAVKLSLAAFLLPFSFVFSPGLLLNGSIIDIALMTVVVAAGLILLCIASEGYLRRPLPVWSRLLVAAGGIGLFLPDLLTDLLGVAAAAIGLAPGLFKEGERRAAG
ncbi:MAG: TRAP transporter permease [Hyphomicrobiaceae bacterium]